MSYIKSSNKKSQQKKKEPVYSTDDIDKFESMELETLATEIDKKGSKIKDIKALLKSHNKEYKAMYELLNEKMISQNINEIHVGDNIYSLRKIKQLVVEK